MGSVRTWAERALGVVILLAVSGCGGDDKMPPERPPRPVTWFELKEMDPRRMSRMTGSVESWKKEMLGFRVRGRVASVIEPGLDIQGHLKDEAGNVTAEGTVIARLDREPYEVAVRAAGAAVRTTEARAKVIQKDIEETLPARIKEAQAELEVDELTYQRNLKLRGENVISQQELDEAKNELQVSSAQLAQVQAQFATRTAELESLKAEVEQAKETLRRAQVDLEDCVLHSPFRGQISKVHVIPGGYAEEGQPVVTVQMMDPMKVQIAVSPETDRLLNLNDVVRVHLDDESEPAEGWVYLKDTVADAATRTFMITLLVRNRREKVGRPDQLPDGAVPTNLVGGLITEHADGEPPFFVDGASLHEDAEGHYVWRADGLRAENLFESSIPAFQVSKHRVKLGARVLPYVQVFTFYEVQDAGDLDVANDLLTGRLPESTKDGDTVFLERERWFLRPGQLVHVDIRRGGTGPGLYVPMHAIAENAQGTFVFVVKAGEEGTERAEEVEVSVGEVFGDFRRVEPLQEGALAAGARVVFDGAHYLVSGQAVNAFDQVEVEP